MATYTLTIEDITDPDQLELLNRQSTYTGRNRSVVEVFTSGLKIDHDYTLFISVIDNHYNTEITNSTNFCMSLFCMYASSYQVLAIAYKLASFLTWGQVTIMTYAHCHDKVMYVVIHSHRHSDCSHTLTHAHIHSHMHMYTHTHTHKLQPHCSGPLIPQVRHQVCPESDITLIFETLTLVLLDSHLHQVGVYIGVPVGILLFLLVTASLIVTILLCLIFGKKKKWRGKLTHKHVYCLDS